MPATARVHPTPIYELIVACAISWWLWRKGRVSAMAGNRAATAPAQAPAEGIVFAAYLVLTGLAPFLVEFIRINPRSFFGFTNAQAASLASLLAGLALYWRLRNPSPQR